MRVSRPTVAILFGIVVALAASSLPVLTQAPAEPKSAKTWIGQAAEYEEYLRTAEFVKMEKIGVGVTNPNRAYLKPGGPFDSMAWKPIRPGSYSGFYESYKAEIAAYELDKLLEMNMVPPTVEREIDHDKGAAIMWCNDTKSFKQFGGTGAPPAPPRYFQSFNREVVKAKMFDDLIANIDPNLGNWLVDPAWNLILIDHTRALTTQKTRPHPLSRIDGPLWEKMKGLTTESLTAALGKWLGKGEIKAILDRRDKMQEEIDKLIKDKGDEVIIR
jgi:hypothetical protein